MIYDVESIPPLKRHAVSFVCGLDLAQEQDASALACLRCEKAREGSIRLSLVHLDQWWMSYPKTHSRVLQTLSREQLAGRCVLAVDATGVGLSFYETFRLDPQVRAVVGAERILPLLITSGEAISRSESFLHVGKTRLIRELHSALAGRTLRIAGRLPLREDLLRQLDGYEARVRASGTVSLGNNPTIVAHDDLVLSVALAVVGARAAFGSLGGR